MQYLLSSYQGKKRLGLTGSEMAGLEMYSHRKEICREGLGQPDVGDK